MSEEICNAQQLVQRPRAITHTRVPMVQAQEVIHPVADEEIAHRKLRQDGCTGNVAYVIFASVSSVKDHNLQDS